jgi:hypothetical protein
MAEIATGAAISAGLGFVSSLFGSKPARRISTARTVYTPPTEKGKLATGEARQINIKSSTPTKRMIFGEVVTGGDYCAFDVKNPYLYTDTLMSEGPIEDFVSVLIEGEEFLLETDSGGITNGGGYTVGTLTIAKRRGTLSQSSLSLLTPIGYTTASKLTGIAHVGAKMSYGDNQEEHSELWGNGVDLIYRVKGLKQYDPRDVGQSFADRDTWTYSRNSALAVLTFLTRAWDRAISIDDIDLDALRVAADICDEQLDGVRRYTTDGVVTAASSMAQSLELLLSACNGAITYSEGLYKIHADGPRASCLTLTDDDVTGPFEIQLDASADERINTVRVLYRDNADLGQETTETVVLGDVLETDGAEHVLSVDLPFTTTPDAAARIGAMIGRQMRAPKRLQLPVNDIGLFLAARDVITIAFANATICNGLYEVTAVDMADIGAVITLKQYAAAAYEG